MEGEFDMGSVSIPSPSRHKSDSKTSGEKRSNVELGERHDFGSKRGKMRDLESVCRSEEINRDQLKNLKKNEDQNLHHCSIEELSQVTEGPIALDLDGSLAVNSGNNTFPLVVNPTNRLPDLNSEVCLAKNATPMDFECAKNSDKTKPSFLGENDLNCVSSTQIDLDLNAEDAKNSDKTKPSFLGENDLNCVSSTQIDLDLNAEDVCSSAALQPKCSSAKNYYRSKSRDISECGSSTGPLEDKDSLRLWKEIKQNGFLSSSHGGIPMPKRGRKSKNNVLKRQLALAKKEQVDRFTKIAAPSGLLNDLNPGIINHVRNRKQVHSIIEALVKSEKLENNNVGSKNDINMKSTSKDINASKDLENVNCAEAPLLSSQGYEPSDTLSGRRETRENMMPMAVPSLISEGQGGDSEPVELEGICGKRFASLSNSTCHEDALALKLSLASKASINAGSLSKEGSKSFTCVSSLSVKAATVASHWLELLRQDIKGRLSALKRSKKRVQAVITVELPFLMAKELSATQDNSSCSFEDSSDGISDSATAKLHQTRWTTLFDQMNKALTEEEKQLESWLNHVKEMHSLCVEGLQDAQLGADHGFQFLGGAENDSRAWKMTRSEKELAIGAAAASIYSTCNFLMENTFCF